MSTGYRSPNCAIGEAPTALFSFSATHDDDDRSYNGTMVSCQAHSHDEPDGLTVGRMRRVAAMAMSEKGSAVSPVDVSVEAHGVALGAHGLQKKARQLAARHMASNCAPDYRLANVTAYNRFTCRYLGTGLTEDGREVSNPFQTWKGVLPSCDTSLKISDDVEEDVRQLVWDAAGGDDARLDVNKFVCSIHSIPTE